MNEYMTDKITVYHAESFDKWGNPTHSSADVYCRFEFKTRLVKDLAGSEVVSSAMVLIDKDYELKHTDKIKYEDIEYAIINIARKKHFDAEYTEVYL